MSKITVDENVCKGCSLCVEFCPKHIMKLKDSVNAAGYNTAHCIDESACIGCGFCYTVCPDCAVTVGEEKL